MRDKIIIPVETWLGDESDDGIYEVPGDPVASQIQRLDATGNGVGLVFVLAVTESDDKTLASAQIESCPVVKLSGKWYLVVGDAIADIAKAVIKAVICDRI